MDRDDLYAAADRINRAEAERDEALRKLDAIRALCDGPIPIGWTARVAIRNVLDGPAAGPSVTEETEHG